MPPHHALRRSHSVRSLPELVSRTSSGAVTRSETKPTDNVNNGNVADNSPLQRPDPNHDPDSDDTLPARPSSRLGYTQINSLNHRHPGETMNTTPRSPAFRWRRSVCRQIDLEVNDMHDDTSSLDPETEKSVLASDEKRDTPPRTPRDDEDVDMEDICSSDDSTGTSDSEYSDTDTDEQPVVSRSCTPEPELEPPSGSCNAPSQPQTVPDSKPKYSCLPSPLSLPEDDEGQAQERDDNAPRNAIPMRHHYAHRGYSFHSLQHKRLFWASRQDRWAESISTTWTPDIICEVEENENDAQCSMDMETVLPEPGHVLPWPPWLYCPRPYCENIHPRTGDLDALRDVYSKNVDAFFFLMPIWTMRKMLWMWAVQAAVAYGEQIANESMGEDEVEVESASTGSTDASDRTLVEDVVGEKMGRCKTEEDVDMEDMEVEEGWFAPTRSSPPNRQPNWALTAHARWELITNWARCQYRPAPAADELPARAQPRFFLGGEPECEGDGWLGEAM